MDRGFTDITRPEDFPVSDTINDLLGSMPIDRLKGIVMEMSSRDKKLINGMSKQMLIEYLNLKFDIYQAQSRDFIFDYIQQIDTDNEIEESDDILGLKVY